MLKEGTLVSWQDAKGFGFIETPDRTRYFLHIKNIKRTAAGRPQVGDTVVFAPGKDGQGRLLAVTATVGAGMPGRIRPAPQRPPRTGGRAGWNWLDLLAIVSLLVLGMVLPRLPHALLLLQIMAGLSGLSLLLYALDKSQARRGGQRVAEKTLQLLALAGGWPGAWLAQRLFHHKTVKSSFRLVFAFAILLQVGVIVGYSFMAGQAGH